MHTTSKSWLNPDYRVAQELIKTAKAKQRRDAAAQTRKHLVSDRLRACPASSVVHSKSDSAASQKAREECKSLDSNVACYAEMLRKSEKTINRSTGEAEKLENNAQTAWRLRGAFGGKKITTPGSSVLARPTVFTPFSADEDEAPWPEESEIKYEGDDRVKTERIHGRFLPAPRHPANETVNWMQRSMRAQKEMENFHYPTPHAVEIFLRCHHVADLEFTDEEGQSILGAELMAMLEPGANQI